MRSAALASSLIIDVSIIKVWLSWRHDWLFPHHLGASTGETVKVEGDVSMGRCGVGFV